MWITCWKIVKNHVAAFTYGSGRFSGPNSISENLVRSSATDLTSYLGYENKIGKHEIVGLLGVAQRMELYFSTSAFRRDFPSNQLTVHLVLDLQ